MDRPKRSCECVAQAFEQLTLKAGRGSSPCAPTRMASQNQDLKRNEAAAAFACRVSFALFTRNSHGIFDLQREWRTRRSLHVSVAQNLRPRNCPSNQPTVGALG
jgi:hypothetical protein